METFNSIKWEKSFTNEHIYISNQIALKSGYMRVRMAALY